MSHGFDFAVVVLLLACSACFSGGETALYSISRVRIEMEARRGQFLARLVHALVRDEVAMLVTVLIGNTLVLQLLTLRAKDMCRALHLPEWGVNLAIALVLTPIVFFCAEALPKELCRRRPHALLLLVAPFLVLARWLFWPLERFLRLFTWLGTRAFGLRPELVTALEEREAVTTLLRESLAAGELPPQAEQIAQNVLKLRTIQVERAMVPWARVSVLDARRSQAELYTSVARSPFTRLPVGDTRGELIGYVHQLDVLGAGPGVPVLDHLRPLVELPAHTPVDRALARLRAAGQRLAIVGTRERPQGLLTLKDLVEEISGDLAGW